MPSPADRFSRLQKVAIFLIAIGEQRAREVLAGVDLGTIEHLNRTILSLDKITPEEKAAVMLEFADFFFEGKPLPGELPLPIAKKPPPRPAAPPQATKPPDQSLPRAAAAKEPPAEKPKELPAPALAADERAVREALRRLREQVDPGKIDWSRAGYDFGEGFKGPQGGRR